MITLTADDATLATLGQANDLAEIRDRTGKLIGYFTPVLPEEEELYARVRPQIDPAELERRRHEPGPRLTTRQVFEYLLTLTTDPATRTHLQGTIAEIAARERCATS